MAQFVKEEHARSDDQRKVLEEINASGKCPFCRDQLRLVHTEPILAIGAHWLLTKNRWPYDNTKHHLLLISTKHAEKLSDLREGAGEELMTMLKVAEEMFGIESAAVFLRFGDPQFNGGSVNHIHAHLIVPDLDQEWETIKVKLGSRKKKTPPSQ